MTSRDDMVIRPQPRLRETTVRERAKDERILRQATSRNGVVGRWLHRQIMHQIGRRAMSSAANAVRLRVSGAGAGGRAAGAAARTPVGLIAAAVIVTIAVGARLISGRSFENMGSNLRGALLGNLDEEALAGRDARRMISEDNDLARFAEINKGVSPQLQAVYDEHKRLALMCHKGDAMINEDERLQANSLFDMVILRVRDLMIEAWNSAGGPAVLEELARWMKLRVIAQVVRYVRF